MVRSLLHLRPCELSLFIYSFFLSIDLSGSIAKSVSTGRSGSLRGRSVFSSLLCDDRPDCRVMLYSLSLSVSLTNLLSPLITRTRLQFSGHHTCICKFLYSRLWSALTWPGQNSTNQNASETGVRFSGNWLNKSKWRMIVCQSNQNNQPPQIMQEDRRSCGGWKDIL